MARAMEDKFVSVKLVNDNNEPINFYHMQLMNPETVKKLFPGNKIIDEPCNDEIMIISKSLFVLCYNLDDVMTYFDRILPK